MKHLKTTVFISIFAIIFTIFVSPASANPSVCGDMNKDGKITASDALIILQSSVGKLPKTEEGDVDHDGNVTAKDALICLQMAVHIITEFPDESFNYKALKADEYYSYNVLTPVQKQLYELLSKDAKPGISDEIAVPEGTQADEIDLRCAYKAYVNDHPESFWMPYSYGYSISGLNIKKILFNTDKTKYQFSADESNEMSKTLEQTVESVIKSVLEKDLSESEIALRFHDYLAETVSYDYVAFEDANGAKNYPKSYTAYGALVDKKATCEGYTKAYSLLLSRVGIVSTPIIGIENDTNGGHMWSCVRISGKWYFTDVTWDSNSGHQSKAYYNQTTEVFKHSHTPSPVISELSKDEQKKISSFNLSVPLCNSTEHNYCVMNGTYFADGEEFQRMFPEKFAKALDSGEKSMHITVSDRIFSGTDDIKKILTNDILVKGLNLAKPENRISGYKMFLASNTQYFILEW